MILIIGGAYQGKKEYAYNLLNSNENKGYNKRNSLDGVTCKLEEIYTAPLIYHFHSLIQRAIMEEWDIYEVVDILIERNPDVVIISNEIGYGVVPMDAMERRYREETGRVMCKIAKLSREVHRVVCGIGTVIKHD